MPMLILKGISDISSQKMPQTNTFSGGLRGIRLRDLGLSLTPPLSNSHCDKNVTSVSTRVSMLYVVS